MNCDDSRNYLPAYLDDELDVAESLYVQRPSVRIADGLRTSSSPCVRLCSMSAEDSVRVIERARGERRRLRESAFSLTVK